MKVTKPFVVYFTVSKQMKVKKNVSDFSLFKEVMLGK